MIHGAPACLHPVRVFVALFNPPTGQSLPVLDYRSSRSFDSKRILTSFARPRLGSSPLANVSGNK